MRTFLRRVVLSAPLFMVATLLAAPVSAQTAPASPFADSEAAGKINVSQTSWIGNTLSGKNEAYMVNYCDTQLCGVTATMRYLHQHVLG